MKSNQKCLPLIFILASLALLFQGKNLQAVPAQTVRLQNGFEVILIENHQSPLISSVVTVRTGSSNEDFTISGISHMLEHLLFNGTIKRTQEELYHETDFYGIYNNAHTDRDYTNYIALVEKSHIEKALDIQADMLFNSIFPQGKFEKEKGIILNEIAKDLSEPSFIEDELFNIKFFYGTPYNLPVIGIPETIKNITREQAREYYQVYYVPNNMSALIMGDFDSKEMLGLVEKFFGKYPPGKLPMERSYPPSSIKAGFQKMENQIFESKFKIINSSLSMGMPLPEIYKDDFYGMTVLASLLESVLKERLNENLKKNNKPKVFNVRVSTDFTRQFSYLRISISFPGDLEPDYVKRGVIEEIHKFSSEPVDDEMLMGIIVSAKAQEISLMEKPHYFGMAMGKFIAAGGWNFAKNYISRLEDIPKTKLEEIAKRYLSTPLFLIILTTPGEDAIESVKEEIKDSYYRIKERRQKEEEIFTDESVKLLNDWKLSPAKDKVLPQVLPGLELKTSDSRKSGITKKIIFANGLTLIVNSNKDSEVFAIHLLAKNRSLLEPEGKTGIADFMHRIMERGSGDMNHKILQKELNAIGATLKTRDSEFIPYDDYYTTNEYSYIRLETIDGYYARGIEILSQLILNPRFETEEIESVRTEMLNLIKNEDSKPDTLSKKLFFAKVFAGLPQSKSIIGTTETINSITKKDLENFHKIFFSPNNLIITVATGITADKIIEKFKNLLESMDKREINIPATDFSNIVSNAPEQIHIDSIKPQSYIRLGKFIKITPQDKAALRLLGHILSERMSFELREKQGLAYSLGAGFLFYDSYALFITAIGTRKETLDNARDGILKEIEGLRKTEIKERDLERVVNKYISSELMRGLSRINQCYYTGLAEFYKKGIDYQKGQFDELRAVKLEDILKAKDKYLTVENMTEVIIR